jgi:mannose-6-phosphate isomerase-like protein (cupin superfamily)
MKVASVVLCLTTLAFACFAQQEGILAWAPKLVAPERWTGANKPHVAYSDLLARHKGQPNWTEVVLDDSDLHGEFISSAPGTATPPQLHPDTREWWVITEGRIRFNIEGQDPFVASRGWMVQVPYRTVYSMQTVGDTPSLRLEVNIAHALTMYPLTAGKPAAKPGIEFVPVRVRGVTRVAGGYENGNKPFTTWEEMAAKVEKLRSRGHHATLRVVNDDRGAANFIYGYAKELPPTTDADKGHFHEQGGEFWIIMSGEIEYKIETQPTFIAKPYDVVYVPPFTWHRARFHGDAPATRLAMNGFTEIAHLFDATGE